MEWPHRDCGEPDEGKRPGMGWRFSRRSTVTFPAEHGILEM
jgi:hypothetical protein